IVNVTKQAYDHGAKVLASPWSPPPALKSNQSDIRGTLLVENYQAYVNHINDFIELMADNGVELYAISIQNEPDWPATYESCDWNANDMRDFIRDFGSQINARIAAPESLNFNRVFTDAILNDAGAAANLDIVAGHLYGGGAGEYSNAEQKGKEIWMTEYL